jgi:hypothetical protein
MEEWGEQESRDQNLKASDAGHWMLVKPEERALRPQRVISSANNLAKALCSRTTYLDLQ